MVIWKKIPKQKVKVRCRICGLEKEWIWVEFFEHLREHFERGEYGDLVSGISGKSIGMSEVIVR